MDWETAQPADLEQVNVEFKHRQATPPKKDPGNPFRLLDRAAKVARAVGTMSVAPVVGAMKAQTDLLPDSAVAPTAAGAGAALAQTFLPGMPFAATAGAGGGGYMGQKILEGRQAMRNSLNGRPLEPRPPSQAGEVGTGMAGWTLLGSGAAKVGGKIAGAVAKTPVGQAVGRSVAGGVQRATKAIGQTPIGQGIAHGMDLMGAPPTAKDFRAVALIKPKTRPGLASGTDRLAQMDPERRSRLESVGRERIKLQQTRAERAAEEARDLALTEQEARTAATRERMQKTGETLKGHHLQKQQQLEAELAGSSEKAVRGIQGGLLPKMAKESDDFVATVYGAIEGAGNPSYPLETFPPHIRPHLKARLHTDIQALPDEEIEVPSNIVMDFIRGQRTARAKGTKAGTSVASLRDIHRGEAADAALEFLPDEVKDALSVARGRWKRSAPIRDALFKTMGTNPHAPDVETGIKALHQGLSGKSRDAQLMLEGMEQTYGIKVPDDIRQGMLALGKNSAKLREVEMYLAQADKELSELSSRQVHDIGEEFLSAKSAAAAKSREASRKLSGSMAAARRVGQRKGGEFRQKTGRRIRTGAAIASLGYIWANLRQALKGGRGY